MELNCETCGILEHVTVDGYIFGDRLLEGVDFIVKDNNGKPNAIGVTPECQSYFDDLNKKKWLKICEDFCEDLDLATCPKCGDDVVVWGNPIITGIEPPAPKVIGMMRGTDIANLFN